MTEDEITPQRLIYDFATDEGARLGQRTDWFLIFHAILLEAFFTAHDLLPQVIVCVLGCLTSYLWFMTGYRQRWLSRHLGECMAHQGLMGREVSKLFNGIFQMRREGLPKIIQWPRPVPTFAVVIPFSFATAWFSLLFWVGRGQWPWVLAAVVSTLLISTIWIVLLGNGPTKLRRFVDPLVSADKCDLPRC
jgi:hypothetical protein